jgi:hypothetical protein
MSNKERGEKMLNVVGDYLDKCGWFLDEHTLLRVDPLSKAKYSADSAFVIQIARDILS